MMQSKKIIIALLIVVSVGFFYKASLKNASVYYISVLSDGDLMKTLKSKLLSPKQNPDELKPNKEATVLSEKDIKSQEENKVLSRETTKTIPKSSSSSEGLSPSEVLKGGDAIIFMETTDKLNPSTLAICSIESAARHYPNRPVAFFMKGVNATNAEEVKIKHLPLLLPFKNVHLFPLKMEEVFAETPLISWYRKVIPAKERYWIHNLSDACRQALLWKYGGIYMDTDIISLRQIPHNNFLAAETLQYSSSAVFGFRPKHEFTWKCMEDFARDYRGYQWGYQGPLLFTRIRNKLCNMAPFTGKENFMCGNMTIVTANHFYPFQPMEFLQFYKVWEKEPTFDTYYAIHLWNYANYLNSAKKGDRMSMVPGSNTLVEHLYQKNCPSLYADIAKAHSATKNTTA